MFVFYGIQCYPPPSKQCALKEKKKQQKTHFFLLALPMSLVQQNTEVQATVLYFTEIEGDILKNI